MYKDMLAAGLNLNYPQLARIVAEQSNDTVEWTMKRVGAQYKDQINMMGGHSVPRTLQTANGHGSEVVGKQIEALKKDRRRNRFSPLLTHLFRDANGRVVGVEVRQGYEFGKPESGTVKNIKASKVWFSPAAGFPRTCISASLKTRGLPRITNRQISQALQPRGSLRRCGSMRRPFNSTGFSLFR